VISLPERHGADATVRQVVRDAYLATAHTARALIASPEVGRRWDDPSALARMSIGAVAAHLARGVVTVRDYMAMPLPDPAPAPVTATEYFAMGVPVATDLDDDFNTGIRARSDSAAAGGQAGVLGHLDDALATVAANLAAAPADARVAVFGSVVMPVDEYLVTRLVELTVHLDDLATSIGHDTPAIDSRAVDLVTACLVGIARVRHGDIDVIRMLARRERAPEMVFPVF
jgi:hypothetical protein